MKSLIDIHVVLATPDDMDVWDEQAEDAADRINDILHCLYDKVDEDIDSHQLEKMLHHVWESWREDRYLLDIDEEELIDWVDHLLATWDDEHLHTDSE
ncbi:hypothetical protein P2G88_04660 [Aliiglaciecola sp. CAU 1673]|uniref:hypothetical protein n=1 Tax=Aliiglaciecola sp. CAU 1673 TaxID=3032595 RepID=UPI0023DBF959|nr:hypothetical protein [Aliiglaciecola sp. CAU 1673]MDF2177538.1 hypothetical protein [Aliiglaciecola sp. CAU 1673]